MNMQRQTTGMPYLLTDKQCIQQITRPRMGKKRNTFSINCSSLRKRLYHQQARSHTLYGNIFTRCGCSFPSCPEHCITVHSFARSKLQNVMNDVRLFSRVLVLGNSMCIDKIDVFSKINSTNFRINLSDNQFIIMPLCGNSHWTIMACAVGDNSLVSLSFCSLHQTKRLACNEHSRRTRYERPSCFPEAEESMGERTVCASAADSSGHSRCDTVSSVSITVRIWSMSSVCQKTYNVCHYEINSSLSRTFHGH